MLVTWDLGVANDARYDMGDGVIVSGSRSIVLGIASLLVHFARTCAQDSISTLLCLRFAYMLRALTDYQDSCVELTRHIQPLVIMIKRISVDAIVRKTLPC